MIDTISFVIQQPLFNLQPCWILTNWKSGEGLIIGDDDAAKDNAWWKMNLYFTRESRNYRDVFSVSIGLKTGSSWICKESIQLQIEKSKVSRRGSCCPEYAELGHFTLLFCRERLGNVPRFQTRGQSYCFALLLFGDVLVAVAVVVFLSSLM